MNNFEILNLLESRYGKIPTIARSQLLDIFELYNLELNQIEFSLKPIRDLNFFFKKLHLKGVRNDNHSILEKTLKNGSPFEYEITEYLFNNDEESPFSNLHMGFEDFDEEFSRIYKGGDENSSSQNTETDSDSRDTTGKASAKLTNNPRKKNKGINKP